MKRFIVFDFDGVILESVDVKSEAFYQIYLPFGTNIAQKAKQHHTENGGMSRFEKFKYYHKVFLSKELTPNDIDTMSKTFSEIILENVLKSPFVLGAKEALETLRNKYDLWVISGTPTEELRYIIKKRELSHFFKESFGSPISKKEHLKTLIQKNNYLASEGVFVGDATADYEAARSQSMDFILRETTDNSKLFSSVKGIQKASDLTTLLRLIETL